MKCQNTSDDVFWCLGMNSINCKHTVCCSAQNLYSHSRVTEQGKYKIHKMEKVHFWESGAHRAILRLNRTISMGFHISEESHCFFFPQQCL